MQIPTTATVPQQQNQLVVGTTKRVLPFEEVPGPALFRHIARMWSVIPVVGTEMTASAIQYMLSAGKLFGNSAFVLSIGKNSDPDSFFDYSYVHFLPLPSPSVLFHLTLPFFRESVGLGRQSAHLPLAVRRVRSRSPSTWSIRW